MYLGLDVGTKRVGVALGSEAGEIHLKDTFERAQGRAEQAILELIEVHEIMVIVVGLPLGVTGERSEQCRDVERFARRLERRSSVKLVFQDEFLSSEEAKQRLGIVGSPSPAQRKKGVIDAVAASIILQAYVKKRTDASDQVVSE